MTSIHPVEIWTETKAGWLLSWQEHELWCSNYCDSYWYRSNGVFWFEESDDAVYFALRWA
jgi:hypothetical protein